MAVLKEQKLLTPKDFDEEIEWTWFYLWHHEGRRARHGASMMAPDYAHWHGMYEVAERFYIELIPQARELAEQAREQGNLESADAVEEVLESILNRPEHEWFMQQKDLVAAAKENTTEPAKEVVEEPAAKAAAEPATGEGSAESPAESPSGD